MDILLWHYRDDDVPGAVADVHLVLTGLSRHPGLKARVWQVDRENGDAFTAWKAMDSPSSPTRQQIAQLVRASGMVPRSLRVGVSAGKVELETRLPLQGVELIELAASVR